MKNEFIKSKYDVNDIEKIESHIKRIGFDPLIIKNETGYVYHLHKHKETKLLVIIEGSMEIIIDDNKYKAEPGDQIIISGDTPHSAIVGDKGCKFFWSEKIF